LRTKRPRSKETDSQPQKKVLKAIPESVSSGDDDDDGSSDEGGEQRGKVPRRKQSRGQKRVSKHGPRALSRREILEAEGPDNVGLQWLKKRGELSSKVQARLEALVPVDKSLDRLWKKSETSTIVTCQSRRRS